jgi:hypothetical protein
MADVAHHFSGNPVSRGDNKAISDRTIAGFGGGATLVRTQISNDNDPDRATAGFNCDCVNTVT